MESIDRSSVIDTLVEKPAISTPQTSSLEKIFKDANVPYSSLTNKRTKKMIRELANEISGLINSFHK